MGCRIASNARDSNQDPEIEDNQNMNKNPDPAKKQVQPSFSVLQKNMDKMVMITTDQLKEVWML